MMAGGGPDEAERSDTLIWFDGGGEGREDLESWSPRMTGW